MKWRDFRWHPARYLVVGATCAVANNVLMIVGDWAGVHYAPMTLIATLLVIPLGYLLHSGFTFGERPSWPAFFRFASGIAVGFPISLATFALLCSGFRLPMVIAAPIATVILFVWNYASSRWAILGKWRIR